MGVYHYSRYGLNALKQCLKCVFSTMQKNCKKIEKVGRSEIEISKKRFTLSALSNLTACFFVRFVEIETFFKKSYKIDLTTQKSVLY